MHGHQLVIQASTGLLTTHLSESGVMKQGTITCRTAALENWSLTPLTELQNSAALPCRQMNNRNLNYLRSFAELCHHFCLAQSLNHRQSFLLDNSSNLQIFNISCQVFNRTSSTGSFKTISSFFTLLSAIGQLLAFLFGECSFIFKVTKKNLSKENLALY